MILGSDSLWRGVVDQTALVAGLATTAAARAVQAQVSAARGEVYAAVYGVLGDGSDQTTNLAAAVTAAAARSEGVELVLPAGTVVGGPIPDLTALTNIKGVRGSAGTVYTAKGGSSGAILTAQNRTGFALRDLTFDCNGLCKGPDLSRSTGTVPSYGLVQNIRVTNFLEPGLDLTLNDALLHNVVCDVPAFTDTVGITQLTPALPIRHSFVRCFKSRMKLGGAPIYQAGCRAEGVEFAGGGDNKAVFEGGYYLPNSLGENFMTLSPDRIYSFNLIGCKLENTVNAVGGFFGGRVRMINMIGGELLSNTTCNARVLSPAISPFQTGPCRVILDRITHSDVNFAITNALGSDLTVWVRAFGWDKNGNETIVNNPRKVSGPATVASYDHERTIMQIGSAQTLTVPAGLPEGFWCETVTAVGAQTVDGPGGTNLAMTTGQKARIEVINGVARAYVPTLTDITT